MKNDLVYGLHSVNSLLANNPWRVKQLLIVKSKQTNKRYVSLIELAHQHKITITWCEMDALDKLADANHQGVLAVCQTVKTLTETHLYTICEDVEKPLLLLFLDNITDPHNVGACLRSAAAFNIDAVIVTKHHGCGLTDVVKRVALGAAEIIPFIEVTNLAQAIAALKEKEVWFYGLDSEGSQAITETTFAKRSALVLGAEGTGIRRLTRAHCDTLINIPIHQQMESLNVAVAAGISLFAVRAGRGA